MAGVKAASPPSHSPSPSIPGATCQLPFCPTVPAALMANHVTAPCTRFQVARKYKDEVRGSYLSSANAPLVTHHG